MTLGFVCRELSTRLVGGRVDRVQQPERDELHILIRSLGENHRLLLCAGAHHARVHLTRESKSNPMEPPMFCMLLRKHLQGGRVMAVRRVGGDRIVEIDIDALDELGEVRTRTLVMEVMGRHSNLILRDTDGRIIDAIRHVDADMSRVREVQPGLPYAYPPAQGKCDPDTATAEELARMLLENGPRMDKALLGSVTGLSPQAAREFAFRLTGEEEGLMAPEAAPALAQRLRALLDQLPSLAPPVLQLNEESEAVDVYPFPQHRFPESHQRAIPEGISEALDAFYRSRDRKERVSQRTSSLLHSIKTHLERCEKKLVLQQESIDAGAHMEEWRIYGELLTGNLYRMEKGAASVTVENYYDPEGAMVTIALDPQFTPAQNAQRYFKRYQKARSAVRMATDQKEKTQAELDWLETQLDDLRKCVDDAEIEEMRAMMVERGYLRASHSRVKQRKLPASQPLRFRSSEGIDIYVGKNSAQNDRLTSAAGGEQMWLHAKDMPGSHVLIAHEGEPPEATLREAAMLAAYYSKGCGSTRVPVDYTLRKHVKKPGGAPLGFVIYTHQHTIWATPDEASVKRLENVMK